MNRVSERRNRHDFSAPQSLIVLIALIAPSIAP